MVEALAADILAQVLSADDRTVPTLRRIRRSVTHRIKTLEAADVIKLALRLLSKRDVPRWFSYELVHHHRGAMAALTEAHLQKFGQGLSAWEQVDTFAVYLSGPAWREGQIGDKVVHDWAVSSDRWWRRVAVVSTVALNSKARGGSGDPSRTLALCEIVKNDRDDMVVKAVSWALRALAAREPAAVRDFLRSHDGLPARVMREVRNKLETGLKNPKSKI